MTGSDDQQSPKFGGHWTLEKLDILENYLDAYTTALKGQPFNLVYVDAFAGTGLIELPQNDDDVDKRDFISGSAGRAIRITDKAFDRLIFVEQDTKRCEDLERLRNTHYDRNIEVMNSEANYFLRNLQEDWRKWRGVLFLDPVSPRKSNGRLLKRLPVTRHWIPGFFSPLPLLRGCCQNQECPKTLNQNGLIA